jgi:branched-chain amino acid transport system permease protein
VAATAATATSARRAAPGRQLTRSGLIARAIVGALIVAAVLLMPLLLADFQANAATEAVIFAVIGLSMNVLTGHAGQISLGHQAFVGVGAFASGYMATEAGLNFFAAFFIAGVVGALSAALLGLVALRLKGLYLALLTLAYGAVAEASIFNIRALTRGGEGMPAPRPAGFVSARGYLYLCLIVLAVVLAIDWRLVKSKAGRAIVAIRHDERVAATMGINVTFYKIFAFVLSGFLAGLAGSLFAHWQEIVVAEDFVLPRALTWVFMTVVGGLGSRAGVVIGSAFFSLFPFLFSRILPDEAADRLATSVPLIGAVLLVLTLTLNPGGIGQQLIPIRRWLAGGPLRSHHRHRRRRPGDVPQAEAVAAQVTASAAGDAKGEGVDGLFETEPIPVAAKAPSEGAGASGRGKRRRGGRT